MTLFEIVQKLISDLVWQVIKTVVIKSDFFFKDYLLISHNILVLKVVVVHFIESLIKKNTSNISNIYLCRDKVFH